MYEAVSRKETSFFDCIEGRGSNLEMGATKSANSAGLATGRTEGCSFKVVIAYKYLHTGFCCRIHIHSNDIHKPGKDGVPNSIIVLFESRYPRRRPTNFAMYLIYSYSPENSGAPVPLLTHKKQISSYNVNNWSTLTV